MIVENITITEGVTDNEQFATLIANKIGSTVEKNPLYNEVCFVKFSNFYIMFIEHIDFSTDPPEHRMEIGISKEKIRPSTYYGCDTNLINPHSYPKTLKLIYDENNFILLRDGGFLELCFGFVSFTNKLNDCDYNPFNGCVIKNSQNRMFEFAFKSNSDNNSVIYDSSFSIFNMSTNRFVTGDTSKAVVKNLYVNSSRAFIPTEMDEIFKIEATSDVSLGLDRTYSINSDLYYCFYQYGTSCYFVRL